MKACLFVTAFHVPPGHPGTMKRTGAANVQLTPVSSDLSAYICVHPWFELFSKDRPWPFEAGRRVFEIIERLRVKACLFVTAFHVPPGHPETMKRTGAANVQLTPVSSDLSAYIYRATLLHPWFELFSKDRPWPFEAGHRVFEVIERPPRLRVKACLL